MRQPTREFPRADPEALAEFDERTKICTMNCGPAVGDPRSVRERMFLCTDCVVVPLIQVLDNQTDVQ